MSEQSIEDRPRRGRPPRAAQVSTERRRRKAGSLDRMAQYKLDYIDPADLDPNYVYRWANDEPGRLRMLTKHDDYDHVSVADMGDGFNPEATDSESSERIRMLAGTDKHGNPTYTYLLRKKREFWEADNEAVVMAREDMMAGRVYEGAATDTEETRHGGDDKFYVPGGNSLGGSTARRRGPIAP